MRANIKSKFGFFAVFCLAAVTAAPPGLHAQEDSRSAALEEVIVTAQKREESLQDAPLAVSAFTAEDMERFGAIEFGDVADLAPNMTLRKQPASHSNYAFGARGVAAGETQLAVDSVVGLYLDGVYVGRLTGAAFDIADTERVEVLRGPQGTLYGRNAVGGAINVISNKPTGEFGFRHSFSGGERGFTRNQTTINSDSVSLFGGELAGRLNYARWELDGILKDAVTDREIGDQDSEAWKFGLRWTLDSLSVDYFFDRSEKVGNSQLQQITRLDNFFGFPIATFAIHREAEASGFVSRDRLGTNSVPFSQPETSDVEGHALTLTWDSPWGITFKSISAYREWESDIRDLGTEFGSFEHDGLTPLYNAQPAWDGTVLQTSPLDASGQPLTGVTRVLPGQYVSFFRASRSSEQEQFSQEFQLSGNLFDDRLKYVAGLYYFHERADETNQQFTLTPGTALPFLAGVTTHEDGGGDGTYQGFGSGTLCGDPNPPGDDPRRVTRTGADSTLANACFQTTVIGGSPVFNYGSDNDAYAIYLHGEYALSDLLNLTVGVRYTEDERAAYLQYSQIQERDENNDLVFDADGKPVLPVVPADDDWTKVTWDVALDYQWNEDINVYGRVATSYRAGGYNTRAPNRETFVTPFDEEDILSYEVGAKTQWFDDRLRLNTTLFRADYEDTQTSIFSPSLAGATSIILNAGEQTNQGVEIEILAVPATGLTFGLNYGYLDAEFDEFPASTANPTVAYAPDNTASGWGEYQFPALDWGQLSIWVGFSYSGSFTISAGVPLDAPANEDTQRSLWDARLTLSEIPLGDTPGNLRIAFWGRNLGNEEYREFVIPFGTFDVAIYGELRSAGLDVVYEF